ncbi:MAG TPA: hypothetical protein VHY91_16455 [Pirellulales bacterium]|jgi:hypothetical protein|nr:hypothetical protein [Pirellulales bacterium]
MLRHSLRASLAHVGQALREPEDFTLAWHRQTVDYRPEVWLALGLTAVAGTLTYGMTMGIGLGVPAIAEKAGLLTLAAGLAWAIPLPALYILNSMAGSRLRASTTLLAALVTTSWGGLALVASVPIHWFFRVAIPAQVPELFDRETAEHIVLGVNLLVFMGVGMSMVDVFWRVITAVESRLDTQPFWFPALIGMIGGQLFYLFGLFTW